MVSELISPSPVRIKLAGVHLFSMNQPLRLKYVTDGCLLLINPKGKIRVLYTPFRVQCINASSDIPEKTWVYVESVSEHKEHLIAYLINGELRPFNHFQLTINF